MSHSALLRFVFVLVLALGVGCMSAPASSAQPLQIPARGTFNHSFEITTAYDRFNDVTWVEVELKPHGARAVERLTPTLAYKGNVSAGTPSAIYMDWFCSVAASSGWMYLDNHDWILLLDGQRMPLQTKRESKVTSGSLIEVMQAELTPREFLRIVNAQRVEGRIGQTEFQLEEDEMEALRDLASRMNP